MTTRGIKYGLLSGGIVLGLLSVRYCGRSTVTVPAFVSTALPGTLAARIAVTGRTIAVQSSKGTQTTYVPEGGQANVSVAKDGSVVLDVKHFGFRHSPVFGILIVDKLRLAGGLQIAYWNRFEGYVGFAAPAPIGFAGLGYRLDQLGLNNSSVYVAYTTHKEFGAGVLVRF